jgi:hypothetical protein
MNMTIIGMIWCERCSICSYFFFGSAFCGLRTFISFLCLLPLLVSYARLIIFFHITVLVWFCDIY